MTDIAQVDGDLCETAEQTAPQRQVDAVVRRVARKCGLSPDEPWLHAEVDDQFAVFSDAAVRDFVPIFVERAVLDRARRAQP